MARWPKAPLYLPRGAPKSTAALGTRQSVNFLLPIDEHLLPRDEGRLVRRAPIVGEDEIVSLIARARQSGAERGQRALSVRLVHVVG